MPPKTDDHSSAEPGHGGRRIRLQRVLADAGIAARRVCEQLITEGHVSVNDEIVRKLPVFVDPAHDDIRVDGRPIPKPDRPIYLMVHKPARTLVTIAPEPGDSRHTILQWVDHPATARLFPVGRLDYDTTGLVLLTNDGDLANRLTHPRYETPKTYLATVKGTPTDDVLAAVNKQLRKLDERQARIKFGRKARIETVTELALRGQSRPKIRVVQSANDRSLVEIALVESRHGQIEELLRILGCPVKKLVRVAYGPVVLRGLAPGKWRELTRDEVRALRDAAHGKGPKTPPIGLGAEQHLAGTPDTDVPPRQPVFPRAAESGDTDSDAPPPNATAREADAPPSKHPMRARRNRPQRAAPPADWTWRAVGRARPSSGQRERDLRRAQQIPSQPRPTDEPQDGDDSAPSQPGDSTPQRQARRPIQRPRFGPNTQFRDGRPIGPGAPPRPRAPKPLDPFDVAPSAGPRRGPKGPPRARGSRSGPPSDSAPGPRSSRGPKSGPRSGPSSGPRTGPKSGPRSGPPSGSRGGPRSGPRGGPPPRGPQRPRP